MLTYFARFCAATNSDKLSENHCPFDSSAACFSTPHTLLAFYWRRDTLRGERGRGNRVEPSCTFSDRFGLFLQSDRKALYTPLSTASLGLGRHEHHQTRSRFTDLLGRAAEHNIQQTTFTMTAQDQHIGF
jgi:hypothetical protein